MHEIKPIIDFIRSTFHELNDFIPLHVPRFIGNEKKHLNECIDTKWIAPLGPSVNGLGKLPDGQYGGWYSLIQTSRSLVSLGIECMLAKF